MGEALRDTVTRLDISILDAELAQESKRNALSKVASFGLRGELFFPVPYLLSANPYLLGYYRLLYGFSQKDFYSQGPFGSFNILEERGEITPKISDLIHPYAQALLPQAKCW